MDRTETKSHRMGGTSSTDRVPSEDRNHLHVLPFVFVYFREFRIHVLTCANEGKVRQLVSFSTPTWVLVAHPFIWGEEVTFLEVSASFPVPMSRTTSGPRLWHWMIFLPYTDPDTEVIHLGVSNRRWHCPIREDTITTIDSIELRLRVIRRVERIKSKVKGLVRWQTNSKSKDLSIKKSRITKPSFYVQTRNVVRIKSKI